MSDKVLTKTSDCFLYTNRKWVRRRREWGGWEWKEWRERDRGWGWESGREEDEEE